MVWVKVVNCMNITQAYLLKSKEAREFAEQSLAAVVSILLEQQAHKTGLPERQIIQESIIYAVSIVAIDLEFQTKAKKE